ncbi:MAG: hypothetical protein WCH04_07865 [Gammaproteobacteria bacterium]
MSFLMYARDTMPAGPVVAGTQAVFINTDRFHRGDAKDAEKFCNKKQSITLRSLRHCGEFISLTDGHCVVAGFE